MCGNLCTALFEIYNIHTVCILQPLAILLFDGSVLIYRNNGTFFMSVDILKTIYIYC